MKKILIIAIFLLLLTGPVAAYEIVIDAPSSVNVGEPILVNGTTDIPVGISFDITLSHSDYVTEIKDTRAVVIQEGKNFSVVFPTTGYVKGIYKIEVLPISQMRYLGNSVTLRVVELKDRSDEVILKSPTTQHEIGTLTIAGTDKNVANKGIEIEVTGPGGTGVFGPAYITTSNSGTFSKDIAVNTTGNYTVKFSDQQGFIGTFVFKVLQQDSGAVPISSVMPVSTTLVAASSISSASLPSSRDQPAYFTVITKTGPVRVYTSSGTDWVIEYVDDTGKRVKVNNKGHDFPEEVTVQGNGNARNFMVYPSKYSDSGTVTLYAENANDVKASTSPPSELAGTSTVIPDTTTKTSFPAWIALPATGVGLLVFLRKK